MSKDTKKTTLITGGAGFIGSCLVRQLVAEQGHFISPADVKHMKNHCVLAARVAKRLFPYEDPIGERVYFPEHTDFYTVVGVLQHRNATAAIGGSLSAQDFSNDHAPCTRPVSRSTARR